MTDMNKVNLQVTTALSEAQVQKLVDKAVKSQTDSTAVNRAFYALKAAHKAEFDKLVEMHKVTAHLSSAEATKAHTAKTQVAQVQSTQANK